MWLPCPRQVGTCAAGKDFYTCAKGPFTGCCSTDPCDSGFCGDDSDSNGNSNPTNVETSNRPSVSDKPSLTASTAVKSPQVISLISSLTSGDPTKSTRTSTASASTVSASKLSASTASPSGTTRQSAIPTAAETTASSAPNPKDSNQPPVGAIVGGVLGGLSLLALLALLIRYLSQRQAKASIKIDRGKKKKSKKEKKREKELAAAEAAVLEREKFLDAAKDRAEREVRRGDPFAEFGGDNHDSYIGGQPGPRYDQPANPFPSSDSAYSHTEKLAAAMSHTTSPASNLVKVQHHGMSLPSIGENENFRGDAAANETEVPPIEMPVSTKLTNGDEQGCDHIGMAALPSTPQVDSPVSSDAQRVDAVARRSFSKSTDRSLSSNTGSPVSGVQSKVMLGLDEVVMGSNLNVRRTRRGRPGSVGKHVMSFMEYEAENESACSSERESLIVAGKAHGQMDRSN